MFRQRPQGKASLKGGESVEVQESLSPLERIIKLGQATLALQRLVCVHELVDTAHEVGYDFTLSHLLPLVKQLASDTEVLVRQELVKHFGDLAGFLIQSDPEQGYSKVVDFLLPILELLLTEKASDVRQGAADALIVLASHLRTGKMGDQVLKIVIELSHNNDDEDARSTAVLLLNNVAETLGRDYCQQFVAVTLVALCEDPAFRVRKSTASNFAEVAKVVDDDVVLRRLIPAFDKLVHDQHWGVRKAAAESLVGVAQAIKEESREEHLVKMMFDLLRDSSRWVRMSGLQQLGYFIAVLERPQRVPAELLTQYVEIIEQTKANPDAADISYHCAFTFAAVSKTMGKECWAKLQVPFASLCCDTQLKTRKAMAASIHIVAETLGSDVTDAEILPQFETLLQDTCDEVRYAAMKNIAAILRVAMPASQKRVLKSLEAKTTGKADNNWRLRHLVASQVGPICEALGTPGSGGDLLATSDQVAEDLTWSVLVPLLLKLCQDAVAEVRDQAARSTARALKAAAPELFADQSAYGTEGSSGCFSGERPELPSKIANLVRHLIKTFARGRSFRHRMTYIRMCDSVIRDSPPQTALTERLFKPLARLATDRVKNVRLCWATTIQPHLRMNRLNQSYSVLAAAHKMAKEDADKEVCRILANASIPKLPEGVDVSSGLDSDLDESGEGETWGATEGGTGESSECGEVPLGEDVSETIDPGDTVELPNPSNSNSSTLDDPVLGDTNESLALAASSQSGSLPEAPSTSTDLRSPTGSSSSSPTQSPGGSKSPKSGPSAPPVVPSGRRLSPTAAQFDPMEDCLVDQREVEHDMDAMFADRRLFHDAETIAPQLKAEKSAPLVNSSELAQRLQAQQDMVDSKANAPKDEKVEDTRELEEPKQIESTGVDKETQELEEPKQRESTGVDKDTQELEEPPKIESTGVVTAEEPIEVASTTDAPVAVESVIPSDGNVTESVEEAGDDRE